LIFRQWSELVRNLDDPRKETWLYRWLGLNAQSGSTWDWEPAYGAFIDCDGNLHSGIHPAGAVLHSENLADLELSAESLVKAQQGGAKVFFLDWGTQNTPWPVLFSLWEEWEKTNCLLAWGPVQVGFDLADRWISPAFLIFREDPATDLIKWAAVFGRENKAVRANQVAPVSLLARAQAMRDANDVNLVFEELPMLPFTLDDLANERFRWPTGVDG
jgi:hypothetical protein